MHARAIIFELYIIEFLLVVRVLAFALAAKALYIMEPPNEAGTEYRETDADDSDTSDEELQLDEAKSLLHDSDDSEAEFTH